jgi:hypothetical protein
MDRSRSRDPAHHLGFLKFWSIDAYRKKRFPKWDVDEIMSEAYVQSHRLLNTVYDPEKSTVVTFLKAFLWGAVHYTYWTSNGFRFTDDGPRLKIPVTYDTLCEQVQAPSPAEQTDLPEFTEEEWTIIRLRHDGYTMTRIATVLGLKSPQSVYNRLVKIRDKIKGVENAPRDTANGDAEGPWP